MTKVMKRVISSLFALALLYCLSFTVSCQGTAPEAEAGTSRVEKILEHLHNPQSKYVIVVSHRGDWRNYSAFLLRSFKKHNCVWECLN